MRRRPALIALGCVGLALAGAMPASAQQAAQQPASTIRLSGVDLATQAGVALGVMGVTSVPDGTVSDLTISRGGGQSAGLTTWQLGTGFTVAEEFPLYLEGYLGYARYDPTFVLSDGQDQRRLPLRWNTLSATVGVGWSFSLTERLQFRPIISGSLGYVASDIAVAGELLDYLTGLDIQALKNGQAATGGVGGALVLAWYDYRPSYELEAELRFSQMQFRTLPVYSRGFDVRSESSSIGLWTRFRWPTGVEAFGRPSRWVLEMYHSEFFAAQRDVLGIDRLTRLGGGIEADLGRWELGAMGLYLQRFRLSGNVLLGDGARGWSFGIGMSF